MNALCTDGTPPCSVHERLSAGGDVFAMQEVMGKPGKPLVVHREEDSMTIVMLVADVDRHGLVRFVLRCERDGDIFASIVGTPWAHSAN